MLNKNVADYTNFDGKTNKKIIQAPGGASSFSIGWNSQKTDYGPQRVMKKKNNYPSYNEQPQYSNTIEHQNKGNFNYNEPIKVMEDRHSYQMKGEQNSYGQKQETYGSSNHQSNNLQQNNKKYGGQYGYNNYNPQEQINQKTKQQLQQQYQDSLDAKVEEHGKTKNSFSRPPQAPQSNHRSSIKTHNQPSNVVFGDNNYNYWKEPAEGRKSSHQSSNRPNAYQQPRSQDKQPAYQQKTSVKVHNPPGGKSSFTLG